MLVRRERRCKQRFYAPFTLVLAVFVHHEVVKLAKCSMWLVLTGGSTLVVVSSLRYLLPGLRHPFLLERIPLSLDTFWLATLKAHVACGLFGLPAGLVLLAQPVRARWPRFHRALGKSYAAVVLFVLVPTGVYLAPYSKLGWASGSGFLASAAFLAIATVGAIRAAERGDARRHRACALHSYAQVASAISFRVYHLAFQFLQLPYETNYVASVWLSVVGNAALAELAIRITHERSHHEISHRSERSAFAVLAEP